MIWPFTNEARRLQEEDRKRKKLEVEEVSGHIKELSKQISRAMNGQKMLIPPKKTGT